MDGETIVWLILLHLTFVVPAVALAYIDKLAHPPASTPVRIEHERVMHGDRPMHGLLLLFADRFVRREVPWRNVTYWQ